jgi:hypothetical protein
MVSAIWLWTAGIPSAAPFFGIAFLNKLRLKQRFRNRVLASSWAPNTTRAEIN